MCLILAIVELVFPSTTPRRSVYGDQGQEVAWEVEQERIEAKHEYQETQQQHKVSRAVGGVGRRVEHVAKRVEQTVSVVEERKLVDQQARREHVGS